MNKLTKVGCSALCGSLAAISAVSAGDLTVTGGADLTWISKEMDTTGNPIGMGSNLTFKGSGELDNGWTFDLTIAHLNGNAYSAANVDIGMGGLGNLMINQGNGNGLGSYDDKMPTAWEEPWGAGLNPGVKLVGGVGGAMNLQYTSPTVLGTSFVLAYAPSMGASDTADKTGGGDANTTSEKGYDAIVNINPSLGTEILSGLNIYAGAHISPKTTASTLQNDKGEVVGGVTLDIGPLSLGYGVSGFVKGSEAAATTPDYYKNHMYGVAFNISDDFSISYGYHDTRKEGYGGARATSDSIEANRYVEVESYQAAYTTGGASIRIAQSSATNMGFSTAARADRDMTTISVVLAF